MACFQVLLLIHLTWQFQRNFFILLPGFCYRMSVEINQDFSTSRCEPSVFHFALWFLAPIILVFLNSFLNCIVSGSFIFKASTYLLNHPVPSTTDSLLRSCSGLFVGSWSLACSHWLWKFTKRHHRDAFVVSGLQLLIESMTYRDQAPFQ